MITKRMCFDKMIRQDDISTCMIDSISEVKKEKRDREHYADDKVNDWK
jgi:hypothetical protein